MKTFTLDSSKKIVIYGGGGNSDHLVRLFKREGVEPECIIDKRARELGSIEGVAVITLDEFAKVDYLPENVVVIISVKNVFSHTGIAASLIGMGFDNIIYKPYGILQGKSDPEWDSVNDAYEKLIENETYEEGKIIYASRSDHLMAVQDDAFVSENGGEVLCFVPAELLENYKRDDAYRLIPMSAFYPIVDMYRYMFGEETGESWESICEHFMLYSGDWLERTSRHLTDSLKRSMIRSRTDVFGQMQGRIDRDREFFNKNCVRVRKRIAAFYLESSGRNRVSFMIARKMKYLPVKMSLSDYSEWTDSSRIDRFKIFLEKNCITSLYSTVPHPYFYSFPVENADYERQFCMRVIMMIVKDLHFSCRKHLGDHDIIDLEEYKNKRDDLRIYTALRDDGIMGRLLIIHGFSCCRSYPDEEQRKISEALDDLVNVGSLATDIAIDESDILIADREDLTAVIGRFKGKKIYCVTKDDGTGNEHRLTGFVHVGCFMKGVWNCKTVRGDIYERIQDR